MATSVYDLYGEQDALKTFPNPGVPPGQWLSILKTSTPDQVYARTNRVLAGTPAPGSTSAPSGAFSDADMAANSAHIDRLTAQGNQGMTPQAIRMRDGLMREADRRRLGNMAAEESIVSRNTLPRNQWEYMAWKDQQPQPGLFGSLVGNQLKAFTGYGDQLNQTYNSAAGPYGQLQWSATQQRPSVAAERVANTEADAARDVARIKASVGRDIARSIGGSFNNPLVELSDLFKGRPRQNLRQQYGPSQPTGQPAFGR